MELFATRHLSEQVIALLTSKDIKTINDFLINDETAVFVRKSNAGNLIFKNTEGEIIYRLKDHQFLAPLKPPSLLSAEEAIPLFKTLMLKK